MISVVGGGPTGCIAASHAAKKHKTTIYDSQGLGARRIQCSGLLSRSGLSEIGVNPLVDSSRKHILNSVRGAKIFSPSGFLLQVDGGKNKAYVFDRSGLDNYFLGKAIDAGVEVIKETIDTKKLSELQKKSEKIILASGTNYNLHRSLGLDTPKKFLYGAQYEMKIECDNEFVEIYLGVPGFFSWIIPAGEYARVGLCTNKNPTPFLEYFVEKLKKDNRIKDEKIKDKQYGVIPIYEPKNRTQYNKIVLVGDAAAQVKATTGGGIIFGCLAAKHACEEDYEKKWRKEIGRELYLHLLIRENLNKLSNQNLDRLIKTLSEKKEVLETRGDMDKASNLIYSLIRDPQFMIKMLLQSPHIIPDLLFK